MIKNRPVAIAFATVLVLGATTALFALQACGDSPGPKAPDPTGSSTSAPSGAPTPTTPTTTTPPPPT